MYTENTGSDFLKYMYIFALAIFCYWKYVILNETLS